MECMQLAQSCQNEMTVAGRRPCFRPAPSKYVGGMRTRTKLALIAITSLLLGGWWVFLKPPGEQSQTDVSVGAPLWQLLCLEVLLNMSKWARQPSTRNAQPVTVRMLPEGMGLPLLWCTRSMNRAITGASKSERYIIRIYAEADRLKAGGLSPLGGKSKTANNLAIPFRLVTQHNAFTPRNVSVCKVDLFNGATVSQFPRTTPASGA